MKKIDLLLENLVLVHELGRLDEISQLIANASQRYGFPYFGLFRRYLPDDDDSPRWQPLIRWLNRHPVGESSEDPKRWSDSGWTQLSNIEQPFYWNDVLEAAKHENAVIYRRLKKHTDRAAEAGLTHGITFPVFSRAGLTGSLTFGSDAPINLSPLEVSLFGTFAAQSLRHCVRILTRDETRLAEQQPVPLLSDRELVILRWIARGETSQEIGEAIGISPYTVDWYVHGLQRKLEARNRQNLIAMAFRLGLIS